MSTANAAAGGGRRDSPWFEDLVILLTLVAFVVGQAVYDLLAANPDLLAARRVSNVQLVLVVVVFGILPAGVIGAGWILCSRLSRSLHRAVFASLIFAFSLALFWQVRSQYFGDGDGLLQSGWAWVFPSLGLSLLAWRRERGVRSFLLALSPAILIFPALFLYRTWRTPIVPPPLRSSVEASTGLTPLDSPNGTPVFVLVFDELGLHVLLDEHGNIDREHYPNFERLSAQSHWFRNATSNSAKTISSLATLATGNLPKAGSSNHRQYPNTLFTLLAPTYDVYIEEVGITEFCDSEAFHCLNDATGDGPAGLLRDVGYLFAARVLPSKLEVGLPDTTHTWGPFQSADDWTRAALARSRRVLHSVDALGEEPFLFFAHLILPHSPYALTPEGEIYAIGPYALDEGQDNATLASLTERYRMQVRYVDGWLGRFLDRLEERDLYDRALVVVTGDHGVSWKPQAPGRRLREENAEMLLSVPSFIKLPFQRQGDYSERDVQHIDLLPTIADVLEMRVPFKVKGRSAFSDAVAPRPKIAFGDDLTRFEFDARLGLRTVETHVQQSRWIGQPVDALRLVDDDSIRGGLEGVQIAALDAPNFGAGMPVLVSGWALRLHPEAPTMEIDTEIFRSGKQGLAFQGAQGGVRQPLAGLVSGRRYRLGSWVQGDGAGSGRVSVIVKSMGGAVIEEAVSHPDADFRPIELEFVAPEGGEVWLELQYQGSPARFVWDDVIVEETSSQSSTDSGLVKNGGFEDASAEPWVVFGPAAPTQEGLEVVVALNDRIIAATRPGAERWDVATRLLNPRHRYLRSGWSVSIPREELREGENPLEAYAVLNEGKRAAVRLDPGWQRALIKQGDLIERKPRQK